jgi:hypothetical protein
MQISEQELRAMVREAVARYGAQPPAAPAAMPSPGPASGGRHESHGLLTLVSGGDADGQCLIEPAVKCNHCGYCLSLGH